MKHFFYLQAFAFVAMTGVHAHGPTDVLVRSKTGDACTTNDECGSQKHCVTQINGKRGTLFSGGYCVQFDCSLENPCDVGAKCVEPTGVGTTVCLAQCASDSHCRNGYHCNESGVCLTN